MGGTNTDEMTVNKARAQILAGIPARIIHFLFLLGLRFRINIADVISVVGKQILPHLKIWPVHHVYMVLNAMKSWC